MPSIVWENVCPLNRHIDEKVVYKRIGLEMTKPHVTNESISNSRSNLCLINKFINEIFNEITTSISKIFPGFFFRHRAQLLKFPGKSMYYKAATK